MLEYFLFSFSVVFPLFGLILVGYLLRQLNIIDQTFSDRGNYLCFKVAIPVLLFHSMYTSDPQQMNWSLMIYSAAFLLVIILLLCVTIPIFFKENPVRGAMIQAIFRSNSVLFGLPLAINLLGEPALLPTVMLIAINVPLCNLMAVIVLEIFKPKELQRKWNLLNILKGIITNPMIIGTGLGIAFLISGIQLPVCVEKLVSSVAEMAMPLSLLVLGATFHFHQAAGNRFSLSVICLMRLLIIPAAVLVVSMAMGCWTNLEIIALLAVFVGPVSVATYAMAEMCGSDGKLAGQAAVTTNLLSVFTVCFFIVVVQVIGLV